MALKDWSTTPASNNSAPPNGAPEDMAPSGVNDVMRQMMADIKATSGAYYYAVDYTDFAAAITAIGATKAVLVISESEAVTLDATVPSTLTLKFLHGGDLDVSTTKTVTINGPIDAGEYTIFKGAGSVVSGASFSGPWKAAWFGAVGDNSTMNTTYLQAAMDFGAAAGGGRLEIGSGIFLSDRLEFPQKLNCRGVSAETTILDFTGGANYGIYITGGVSNFLHGAGLFDLRVQNATSHGVYVDTTTGGGVGESFTIDRVQSYSNGGDGFNFSGDSTPLHLGHLSPHGNTLAGLRFKGEGQTHVQVLYVAGDSNLESLVTIEDASNESSFNIIGWKSERTAAALGHPNIFDIVNSSGGYIGIGPGRYTAQNAAAGNAVVRIASGSSVVLDLAPFSIAAGIVADYAYGVENIITSVTRTTAQVKLSRYRTFPDNTDQSFVGAVVKFANNFRNTIASVASGNTLRFNHSSDGAAATPNIEAYDGTTLISKLTNGGTLSVAGNIRLGGVTTGPVVTTGTGSPESVVTGNVGWIFLRTDGAASTTLYVKESGTGNTGWVAK